MGRVEIVISEIAATIVVMRDRKGTDGARNISAESEQKLVDCGEFLRCTNIEGDGARVEGTGGGRISR